MVDSNPDPEIESRPPTLDDLVTLADQLNRRGARYIVIGGMAMIQAGLVRATADIDLLIESSASNRAKVQEALMTLPDQAVRELLPDDLEKYMVVRVADEIVIDLMQRACGIDYQEACGGIVEVEFNGIKIPFAGPEILLRMKRTLRDKDRIDRLFLEQLLRSSASTSGGA